MTILHSTILPRHM